MKKFILLLVSACYATLVFAENNLQFENRQIASHDAKNKLTLEVHYPQIKNATNLAENSFNQLAKQSALTMIENFKKTLSKNNNTLPADMKAAGSSLKVSYDLNWLQPKKIISVRFLTSEFPAGAAHPNHFNSVINYDLASNKPLTLNELFKPGSKPLEHIAKVATKEVTARLKKSSDGQIMIFKEGFAPLANNYKIWNLTPNGLRITFDEYQVAPYVYGPQEVTIPYKDLPFLAPRIVTTSSAR